ncbi:6064_t:CDS:2, partial [Cetraspora pellucida]
MLNTQSNDLLRKLNAKLLAEIAELRKKNAEIKVENTKLKQDKEDIEVRFAKLEQNDKEKTDLIAKLEWDVSQIKQALVTSQSLILLLIKNHSGEDDSIDSVNLKQTQSAISSEVNSNNISEQTDDTSKNVSNSDPNSSEDKEMDNFLDHIEKKRVSNMIRERNQEKLQKKHSLESKTHQNPDLFLDNQNASLTELEKLMLFLLLYNANTVTNDHDREEIIPSPLLSNAKTVTNGYNQNNVYINSVNISEVFKLDDQIVENLIQEMFYNHIKSVISFKNNFTSLDISGPGEISKSCIQNIILGSVQSLSHLFNKAVKKGQKEILCWYYYLLEFENKVKSLTIDSKITDKTAKTKIYKEIKSFLPNITNILTSEVCDLLSQTTNSFSLKKLSEIKYSNLYKDGNSKNVDYYRITDKTLCPLCKLKHNDEDIEGRYKIGSYYVKCEQHGIEIE